MKKRIKLQQSWGFEWAKNFPSFVTKLSIKKVLLAIFGVLLVCIGVAFNNNTSLGNDPVGIVYDGIRVMFNMKPIHLGYVSNFINIVLIIILLSLGRRYVNIGTALYLLPYGFFITIGSRLYPMIFSGKDILTRLMGGTTGIALYYVGISLFVATEIGVDPFNGIMLTIRDKTEWSIRKSKIIFDICLTSLGILLGGKFGLITLVAATSTGPVIQSLGGWFKKYLKIEKE